MWKPFPDMKSKAATVVVWLLLASTLKKLACRCIKQPPQQLVDGIASSSASDGQCSTLGSTAAMLSGWFTSVGQTQFWSPLDAVC